MACIPANTVVHNAEKEIQELKGKIAELEKRLLRIHIRCEISLEHRILDRLTVALIERIMADTE